MNDLARIQAMIGPLDSSQRHAVGTVGIESEASQVISAAAAANASSVQSSPLVTLARMIKQQQLDQNLQQLQDLLRLKQELWKDATQFASSSSIIQQRAVRGLYQQQEEQQNPLIPLPSMSSTILKQIPTAADDAQRQQTHLPLLLQQLLSQQDKQQQQQQQVLSSTAAFPPAPPSSAGNNTTALIQLLQQGGQGVSSHHASLPHLGETAASHSIRGPGGYLGVSETFPVKVHRMLREVEAAGKADVVSFVTNDSFCIHKPREFFRDIIPHYFQHSRLSSFKRQLHLYNFELHHDDTCSGSQQVSYRHKLFLKDRPDLCRRMKRTATKVCLKKIGTTTKVKEEERDDCDSEASV